uniref:NADP-dependent oxidoreductase domain-containing protein n=1 Tax=Aplanochytrium stocchinoi TaxID=215587 RepID=A0A6S8EN58_9STRA
MDAHKLMKKAYEGGVNFFDNAEAYGMGAAELLMGEAVALGIERNAWTREDLVLSTKIFFGSMPPRGSSGYVKSRKSVNRIGLSRKHIIEGTKASLRRMKLKYVDLVFCHRYDPLCNMEEVVRSFNTLIDMGLCFYWGTSEWTAQQIQEAKGVAERLGLVGPSFDQPEYNLFAREKVEVEFAQLYPSIGLTTWSPLASGVLTGKYSKGVPEGSRLSLKEFKARPDYKYFMRLAEQTEKLRPVAAKLNCTLGQLALAWCLANPNVSTVIGGASNEKQIEENLGALEVVDKLTPEILKEIDQIMGTKPKLSRSMAQVQYRLRPLRHKL